MSERSTPFQKFLRELTGVNDLKPVKDSPYYGPITEELLAHIRRRNEEKRDEMLTKMGEKWLLHYHNIVRKKETNGQ